MNSNISKNVLSEIFGQSALASVRNSAITAFIVLLLVFAVVVQAAGDAEWAAQAKQVNDALRQLRSRAQGVPGAMQYVDQAEKLWKQAQDQWVLQQRYQQQNATNQMRRQLLTQQQNLKNQLIKQQKFLQQQLAALKTPELKTINPFGDYVAHGVSIRPKDVRLHGPGTIADTPELSGHFHQPDMNAKESAGMEAWKEAMRQLDSVSSGFSSLPTPPATPSQKPNNEGAWDNPLDVDAVVAFEKPNLTTSVDLSGISDNSTIGSLQIASANEGAMHLRELNPDIPQGSKFFYALQSRTLTPMEDGGHPIDAPGSPSVGLHGLVGGTTWTYGFQWPQKECDAKCTKDIERALTGQLKLYCNSQSDLNRCLQDGLPFTKESYNMVVSMGSAHTAIQDLATRVLWDGVSFGEFSQQNAPIFGTLTGRQFDTLDCHSNGAMLCLAALRSGETEAKKVRLFGPQINAQAAARWREWANSKGAEIEIYINNGDPVPAISWKQPTPQTATGKAATAAWLTNPLGGPATLAEALMHTLSDSKSATMDKILGGYGFKVKRFYPKGCNLPDINCHSMLLYEKNVGILPEKH